MSNATTHTAAVVTAACKASNKSKTSRLLSILHNGHSRCATQSETKTPVWAMIKSWAEYADTHKKRFECGIGEDYVLGPLWEAMGQNIIGLLNGETGRLDCGDMDNFIRHCLKEEGFDSGL